MTQLQIYYTLRSLNHVAVKSLKSLTCAGDSSKHPALAIFDRPEASLAPLSEDLDAASPVIWWDSISVRLRPSTGQHTSVTVSVDLDGWRTYVIKPLKAYCLGRSSKKVVYHIECRAFMKIGRITKCSYLFLVLLYYCSIIHHCRYDPADINRVKSVFHVHH